MFSFHLRKSLLFYLINFCIIVWAVQVRAHAGHKHGKNEPNIKLPTVVARVNGKDISSQHILKGLKQYIQQQIGRGHKITPYQERSEAKRFIR